MATYIKNEVVEAAKWDPAESECARILLNACPKGKIKKVSLAKEVNVSRIATPGIISTDGLSLVMTLSNGALTASPGEYLVLEKSNLKVMSAKSFEATYVPEAGTQLSSRKVMRMVKR